MPAVFSRNSENGSKYQTSASARCYCRSSNPTTGPTASVNPSRSTSSRSRQMRHGRGRRVHGAPDQTGTAAILYRLANISSAIRPMMWRRSSRASFTRNISDRRQYHAGRQSDIFRHRHGHGGDLQGKLAGLPVHQLLGGAHRRRSATSIPAGRDRRGACERCRGRSREGERVFISRSAGAEKLDLEITRGGSPRDRRRALRLDANEGWSVHDAITCAESSKNSTSSSSSSQR